MAKALERYNDFFSNNWLNMIWFVLALVLGIILIKIICGLLSKGLAKKWTAL